LKVELNEERNERATIENDLENMKEVLNKTKRDLGRVSQEFQALTNQSHQLKSDMEEVNVQKGTDKQLYEQEIKMLRVKIEELEEENEELNSKLQVKSEIDTRVDQESKKILFYFTF
jgi:hypothetical protein